MTADPTGAVIHRARQEEKPPLLLPAHLTQSLQVQHFPQRHTPQSQNILVHIIRLGGRPPLKSRRITTHRRKITVVEPIQYWLFLFQTSVALSIRGGINCMFSQGKSISLLPRCVVVLLHEPRADKDDITDFDISPLSSGSDVNTLRFPAGFEVGIRDPMRGVAAVGDVLGLGVGPVVEEEGAAGEAVVGPVVDAVFVVGGGAVDVGAADAIVEGVGWHVGELGAVLDGYGGRVLGGKQGTYVAEAVPLSPALSIQLILVIVSYTFCKDLYLVLELFSVEGRLFWDVER